VLFLFQAIHSFSKAIRLNPIQKELWDDDLLWACSIRDRMQVTNHNSASTTSSSTSRSSSSRGDNTAMSSSNKDSDDAGGGIVSAEVLRAMNECEKRDSDSDDDDDEGEVNERRERERRDDNDTRDREGEDNARCSVLNVPPNFVHLRG
jgi:hypothetical protein